MLVQNQDGASLYGQALDLMLKMQYQQAKGMFDKALELAQTARDASFAALVLSQVARSLFFEGFLAEDQEFVRKSLAVSSDAKKLATLLGRPKSDELALAHAAYIQVMVQLGQPEVAFEELWLIAEGVNWETEKSIIRACMAAYYGTALSFSGELQKGAFFAEVAFTQSTVLKPALVDTIHVGHADFNWYLYTFEILLCRLETQVRKSNREGAETTLTYLEKASARFTRSGYTLPAAYFRKLRAGLNV